MKNSKLIIIIAVLSMFFTYQLQAQSAIGQLRTLSGGSVYVPPVNDPVPYGQGSYSNNNAANNNAAIIAGYKSKATNINNKGVQYHNNGDYRAAITAYKKALWYNPYDETAKRNLENAKRALKEQRNSKRNAAAEKIREQERQRTAEKERQLVAAREKQDQANAQAKALAREQAIQKETTATVTKEQKELETNTQTWVEYQKEQFKIRTEQPNYWCKNYMKNLEQLESGEKTLADYIPSKKSTQLEPGDVILVGPTSDQSYFSVKQANLDAWANDNNAYVTHTVTCVKVVNGIRFYLDNQSTEGPKIITQDEFQKRYGKRDNSVAELRKTPWGVAQPLNEGEAKKLWDKAMELHAKNRDNTNPLMTNYGLYGKDNMLCSESSWQLINSTGRYHIPFDKKIPLASGIDFTPASFFSNQQYFLITLLDMQK